MKKSTLTLFAVALFTLAGNAQKKETAKYASNMEGHSYKIYYDHLKFGKEAQTKIILDAWHAYDRNMLNGLTSHLADTIEATFPDGSRLKGKGNFMTGMQEYRDGFTSVISQVSAVTTVKSPNDPDHEVTLIWGNETATKKDGTVQKVALHEVWFFNKEGKIARFHQYAIPIKE
jgi:hypothetical protein